MTSLSAASALAGRLRERRGQTSIEYIGIIVVVAVLIAAIAGSGVADDLTRALEDSVRDVVGEND
jgi:pilus assembly protein Flp/PilA